MNSSSFVFRIRASSQTTDVVVLAVCIVVPALRPADFVAPEHHRYPLRKEKRREEILFLLCTERVDYWVIVGPSTPKFMLIYRPCRHDYPRDFVRCALIVTDQILQCEAVMAGHKIDASVGFRPFSW